MNASRRKFTIIWSKHTIDDFVDHPEYRGPKFTWENLPNMIYGLVKVHAPLNFPKITAKQIEKIGRYARWISRGILKSKKLIA